MSKPSTSKQQDEDSNCQFCNRLAGRYACPRCNMRFCTIECYKNPSHVQCSEQFFKTLVQEELPFRGTESMRKMKEILQKSEKQSNDSDDELDSDDDSDDNDDLEARLAGIDLDDSEGLWNVLTNKERAEYAKLLETTTVTQILPDWTPWWIDGNHKPILASNIPRISTLTKTKPASTLPFLVMNTIMAYQICLRVVKGHCDILSVEAATMIYRLSSPLRGPIEECSSLEGAANLILSEYKKQPWDLEVPVDYENITQDLRDLTAVSSCDVLLALSHLITIFTDAIEIVPATKKSARFTGDPPKLSELSKSVKKLTFYLSWAKEMDDDEWDRIVGNSESISED